MNRNIAFAGFLDRNEYLLVLIMMNSMSGVPPISLMPPSERSSLSRSRVRSSCSFLVEAERLALEALSVELAQTLDRGRNGLPIGDHAARPAVVHVILAAAAGRLGNAVRLQLLWCRRTAHGHVGHHLTDLPATPVRVSAAPSLVRSMISIPLRTPKG